MWRKTCNHLCFQGYKTWQKTSFPVFKGNRWPCSNKYIGEAAGKKAIYFITRCNVMYCHILSSYKLLCWETSLQMWVEEEATPWGSVGEWENHTQLRWLVEEVVLLSTWVGPVKRCSITLYWVTCGVWTCVWWWFCGLISALGFPAAWTRR